MAKFNSPTTGSMRTVNHEGYAAYKMPDKTKLVTQVLTSFFNEQKFYGDNSDEIKETLKRVIKKDPEFVSKLAVFARREFNMRSISHVMTAYLAHEVEGKQYVRQTVQGVAIRGDDVTEIMAAYISEFGKPIPNSLKKGIADVMRGFDEYTLAKYKGSGKGVKMADLLGICHPKPATPEQALLWRRLLEGKLAIPETWETELSAHGNNKETWEKLIANNSVGYMAMLRNLRNILNANPSNINKVYAKLADPEAVRKSRQLPFRFMTAYANLPSTAGTKIRDVLEDAISASVANLPKIPGRTLIAIDGSGSMDSYVSAKSEVRCADLSALLGIIANYICDDAYVVQFDHELRVLNPSHRSGIIAEAIRTAMARGGTNMSLPFQYLLHEHLNVDRVIIISDNECNSPWGYQPVQTLADEYRRKTGNDIWVHAIDLQGYGTQQFHGAKTNIIGGWSEKVFDFIRLVEEGEGSLEQTISNYTW